jgi:pathogenesis-related protein 1
MFYSCRFWLFSGVSFAFISTAPSVALSAYPNTPSRTTTNSADAGRIAQLPRLPFPLDGTVVYVSRQGVWQEARLTGYSWRSNTGYLYNATYLPTGPIEQSIPVSRIITLAEAQKRGIATKTYDLSSQAGVNEMLNAHNSVRKRYGITGMTWSPQLATYAQEWANTLVRENRFDHRPNHQYGENLAYSRGQQMSPTDIAQMWDGEVKNYTYATNTCRTGAVCGHYTQLVWRKTTQVGCGMARASGREIWVCNYNPPGNFYGAKPY